MRFDLGSRNPSATGGTVDVLEERPSLPRVFREERVRIVPARPRLSMVEFKGEEFIPPVAPTEAELRAFYNANAPGGLKLSALSVLGPINLMKLEFQPDGLKRKFVAELWMYPDGSRILELSTKCKPNEAFQVAAETRAFLATKDVDTTGEQQTKTKTALEFFAQAAPVG